MADAPLASLAPYFQLNTVLMQKFTGQFIQEDWLYRAGECNHAFWLIGHLALCRRSIRRKLGSDIEKADWESQFGRGGECNITPDDIDPADLVQDFIASGQAILQTLPDVTSEQAAKDSGREFPTGDGTIGGLVRFMHFHESYHLGQIALIARVRGKETIA